MDLIEEARRELAGKIRRLRDTNNFVQECSPSHARRCDIVMNFPKNLPPKGIAYSKNFLLAQKGGMFAVQTK